MELRDLQKDKLYTADDIRTIIEPFIKEKDILTMYGPKEIREIFGLGSVDSARRLMNHPAFPALKIGKHLRVTRSCLIEFLEANSTGQIDLN